MKLQALPHAQFRMWFNLLCFSGEQPTRGTIDYDDLDVLAVEVAAGDTAFLEETLGRLVKLKVLRVQPPSADAPGAITFINFKKRQYDKPSAEPEQTSDRKRKSRAKSDDDAAGHADVTPGHATDTDAKSETKTEADAKPERPAAVTPSAPARQPNSDLFRSTPPGDTPGGIKWGKKIALYNAYCRGVGIKENTAEYMRRQAIAHTDLDGVTDLITPDKLESLSAWVLQDWRSRRITKTPNVGRVLEAETEYDRRHEPTPATMGTAQRFTLDDERAARANNPMLREIPRP